MNAKSPALTLNQSDISAILCALPLISNATANTSKQTMRNINCCNSVQNKLIQKIPHFTSNEIRVIYSAVLAAKLYLGGIDTDFIDTSHIDSEWRKELQKNFFVYNRLESLLEKEVEKYQNR